MKKVLLKLSVLLKHSRLRSIDAFLFIIQD
jgi:hypothetical protein